MPHQILYVVEQIETKADKFGYIEHAAIITRTSDGARAEIVTKSEGQAADIAYALLGGGLEARRRVLCTGSESLTCREYSRLTEGWAEAYSGRADEGVRIVRKQFKDWKNRFNV